jgi:8-oxo-dGTP pyrophosphatase MutT (NUDIX family)
MFCTTSSIDSLSSAGDLPVRLIAVMPQHWQSRNDFGRQFAPELSYGRHFGPAPDSARTAAVIVLLLRRSGRWHIPLTQRPDHLRHGGQISLPGGIVEPGESSADAALRELAEELGTRASCDIIGQLHDTYVYASNFLITPWLAATSHNVTWTPQQGEVGRVLELPLNVLLDQKSVGRMTIERGPMTFRAPCFCFEQDCIWGATAIILAELAELIRRV